MLEPLHLLGMSFSLVSILTTNVSILIQKHSAHVEAGRALCPRCSQPWRWRFWCGFFLNLSSEALLSTMALAFAPLSLIAPLGGVGVVFNALLARFGLVCGITEKLALSEWSATLLVLAGVSLAAVSGPGSGEAEKPFDLDAMPVQFAQPAFLVYTTVALLLNVATLLVFHVPRLKTWRPRPNSATEAIVTGSAAASCGAFSVG